MISIGGKYITFTKFSEKLHEIEKILVVGREAPPLGSTTVNMNILDVKTDI